MTRVRNLFQLLIPLLLFAAVLSGLAAWQKRLSILPQGYERASQLIQGGHFDQARALILQLQKAPGQSGYAAANERSMRQGEWQWIPDPGLEDQQQADRERATRVTFTGGFSLGVGETPGLFECEARVHYRVNYEGNDLVINASISEPENATPLNLEEMQDIEAFVRKERPRWFQPSTGGTVISWLDYRRPGCPDG